MTDHNQKLELYFELKNTPESSRESYNRRIQAFLKFLSPKPPTEIDVSDVQAYILHLKQKKNLKPGTINTYISSIRFFYTHVLGKEWDSKQVPRMRRPAVLPVIPPKEEVLAIINGTTNLKHQAMLVLLYGSGLRVSEVAKLRIRDICSKNMWVRVEGAKHNTNRYSILSETALEVLRNYFKAHFFGKRYKPDDWLFPGATPGEHVNVKTIKNNLIRLRDKLSLDSRISAHTLRHCFATHALEEGVDPTVIQHLLGHRNFATTAKYLHLTSKSRMGIKSPLDSLTGKCK